ncbi:MAG: YggT family protein [Clostridia bacterium]|nr:YggT family protein [Clostridia bacterium]
MAVVFYLVKYTAIALLSVLDMAMFVRAILSWFDPTEEWKISRFLYVVTEPIILPVRRLCAKFHWFEGVPLDIPFLITLLLTIVAQTFLEAL